MAERKLDIFQALTAVDRRDSKWFGRQSEEARKEFAPPVFIRWSSTISDGRDAADVLMANNQFVNVSMWDFAAEHPDLIFKLSAMCGTGSKQKHEWIGMPGRKITSSKVRDLLSEFYPFANDSEIDLLIKMHTRETFMQFVDDTGIAPDLSKEIMKAYDKLAGKEAKGPTKEKSKRSKS